MTDDRFDAFISYNHAADGKLATALRDGLHKFAKPWNRRRAMRVFLDRSSLALTSSLGDALEAKLGDARYLILLASAQSAASPWCNEEARYWIEHKGPETLLLVLTDHDATISWDRDAGHFDPERSTALPPALIHAFPEEPLWLNMAWVEQQGDEAVLELRSSEFRSAVATLSSAIQGIPKDQLDGEDVRQHRKFNRIRRIAIGALAVLTAAAIGLMVVAILNANEARRQESISDAQRASSSADLDMRQALTAAADVYERRPIPETERAMVELLNATTRLQWTRDLDGQIVDAAPAGDLVVWGLADGRVGIVDATGTVETLTTGAGSVSELRVDSTGGLVEVTWDSGEMALIDPHARTTTAIDASQALGDEQVDDLGEYELGAFGARGYPEHGSDDLILDLDDRSTYGSVVTYDFGSSLSFVRERVFFNDAKLSGNSRRVVVLEGGLLQIWDIPELVDGSFLDAVIVRDLLRIRGVDPAATRVELDHDGETAITWGPATIQRWRITETSDVLIAPEGGGGAADALILARVVGSTVEWLDPTSPTPWPQRLDLQTLQADYVQGPEGDQLWDELWALPYVEVPAPAFSSDGRLRAEFVNGIVTVADTRSGRIAARFPSGSDGQLLLSDDARWLVMAMRGGGLQVWALDVTLHCGDLDQRIGPGAADPVCATGAD